ncbi:MAG: gliding motility-associated C-terminal domain-containing protein [Cyclobacteriaceae bacterium]|nr:gliding motility-associated C-terminal domain-containing protein [Cyclobacteriaceae bacterium]
MPIHLKTSIFSFGLLCLLFVSSISYAQDFSTQHWYFGNNDVAVEFTRPNGVPFLVTDYKVPPFNINGKGNATANRPETGDLLFYTDGFEVFDVTYGFMDGITLANKLNADVNKNQSVAIATAPQASANNLYYIFTNTPAGDIHYSEVDMTANGNAVLLQPPLGSVISRNNVIANSTANASDAMLVINDDSNGYWLITLDQGSNDYKALHINNSTPASWAEIISTPAGGEAIDAAHFAFDPNNNKLAVAPKNSNVNIQLFDFDPVSGNITYDRDLLNTGNADFASEAIFDVAFSNNGSKLYYSRYGNQVGLVGNLMQVDLNAPVTNAPNTELAAPVFGSYGLQKGPDGNLYHLYQATNGGPFLVGSLTNIDTVASVTTYTPAIESGQDFNSYQFPAFLPNRPPIFTSLSFTTAGNCANAPTTFYPNIIPAPTNVQWEFGDGATSTELAPFHIYETAYGGDVRLTVFLNGQSQDVLVPVNITDFQLQLTLPQDTVACKCQLPVNGPICEEFSVTVQAQNETGSTSYVWSNGDVGKKLVPQSAGYYYVIATDGACSTYAGVEVQEYDVFRTNLGTGLLDPGITPEQRSNVWYFGNQAGIDFNPPPAALSDGAMNAMEGCTAVSDGNGEIIFYTDGDIIFDQTHTQISLTKPLGGTPNATGTAAQSVIAVAVPDDETLFYIFTTQNTDPTSPDYNFSYSLFDLKENNGLGDIVENNVILFNKSTERITASANWVIIHEYGNNNFRAYPISANGIGSAVVSSIGEDYSTLNAVNGKGYIKLNGPRLGLAIAENKEDGNGINNYLDVFDFNPANGEIDSLERTDLTADGAIGEAYGIEFSGNKIFVSIRNGASSQIMEYYFDINNNEAITFISTIYQGAEIGAIQTGPDGTIYVAQNGVSALGSIGLGSADDQASSYNANGFPLAAGTESQLGLPNYIDQSGTGGASPVLTVTPRCAGEYTNFSTTLSSSIDVVSWRISPEPNTNGVTLYSSTEPIDSFIFNTPGVYKIAVNITNRCFSNLGLTGIDDDVIITINPPIPPANRMSTFLCGGTATLEPYDNTVDVSNFDFTWFFGAQQLVGETNPTLVVTTTGNYSVNITDNTTGCTTNANAIVAPGLDFDLGPAQVICENDSLNIDSQVSADPGGYVWSVNGVVAQIGVQAFEFGDYAINAALGAGTYTVQLEATITLSPPTGPCTVIRDVEITISPAPLFTAVEGSLASCGNPDGIIDLTLASNGNYSYSVSDFNDVIVATGLIDDTSPNVNITGIPAGINTITLENSVSLCTSNQLVVVTNPPSFSIDTVTPQDETCADLGTISFTETGIAGAFTATLFNIDDPSITFTSSTLSFTNLIPAGSYALQVEELGSGCIEIWTGGVIQPIIINRPPDTDLQILQNPAIGCGLTLTLGNTIINSTDPVTLLWSYDDITYNDVSVDINQFGSYTIFVRAPEQPGTSCEVTRQMNVVLTPTPTVNITPDFANECNGNVLLTAFGNGGYAGSAINYTWNTFETTDSITITQSGTYTVTVSQSINPGCFITESIVVDVPSPFTVSIISTLACDDGQPFTLTAIPQGQTTTGLTYMWFRDGTDLGLSTSEITQLDGGIYTVEAEDPLSGCKSTGSFELFLSPLTPTNLSSAPVFCPADSVLVLDAGPNFISYLWSTGDISQTIDVTTGGLYELEAINNFGCITNDQSEAIEDCIPKIDGPNAFRPGGLNTTYSLFTEYIDTFEIFIYNRWGELVYNSTDAAFAWDGTEPGGEIAPAGQYSWVVRYTSSYRDRGVLEQYGGVVLLR